jgi:hypothetical protein
VAGAKLQHWAGVLAVLNLAMIAILSGRPSFTNATHAVRGVSNPVLAMDVVRNVIEVDAVLSDAPSPDREVMRIKQYADFGFICCYAALFAVMGILFGRGVAALGLLAGVFDAIENVGILRILDVDPGHTTQAMIDAIRYPSLVKWALASLALGWLGILLVRTGRTGLRIAGALDVFAALLGLYGLFQPVSLQWLPYPGSAGLVVLAILYFRPYRRNTRRSA